MTASKEYRSFYIVQVCNADLVLLVDSSGSIEDKGKENWNLIKAFLKSVVDSLVIGPQATHVAAITFSNTAFYEFGFLDDPAKIKAGIDTLNYEGGYTNTTGGLRLSRLRMFTGSEGDRPSSPNIIMIITDGNTTKEADMLLQEAQTNKDNGVVIMAIGVTNDIDEAQLLALVSNQRYYHRVDDFDGLLDALASILSSDNCESAINVPGSSGRR